MQRTTRDIAVQLLARIAEGVSPDLAELYAADAVVELPFAAPGGLRLEGRAQIREHFAGASRAPVRLTPSRVRIHETHDPEVVVVEYDYDGEVTTTGARFTVANVQVITGRDGLIVESRDYHDHAALAAAFHAQAG